MTQLASLFQKIKQNVLAHPFSFFGRQLYRALVFPFVAFVTIGELILVPLINWYRRSRPTTRRHCFVVTSVVYPKQKELSYAGTRSVFNPEERATQTVQTIRSIRAKVPGAYIILVESGLQKSLLQSLATLVDRYVYVGDHFLVRAAVDSKFKSLGEAVMLLAARPQIVTDANWYFKISGRYFLDEEFRIDAWESERFRVFYIKDQYISTRAYSFGRAMLPRWYTALVKGLPFLFFDYPIEHILATRIPSKYLETVGKVGVMGADATTGKTVKE